jgi:hypothetical protein
MTRHYAFEDASPSLPERSGDPAERGAAADPGGQASSAETGGRDGQPNATADGGEEDDSEYEPL